ncbi:hypothetical protein IKG02_00970 [Candidatus Saccharibacteria bacterium]|nr:hypothetical protein [Candidatus Saccharibacteria bacterium]
MKNCGEAIKKYLRGDSLIEVLMAVAVFGAVSIGAISIMNRGMYSAQEALEVTMARSEIDTQAEALRFLHDASSEQGAGNETIYGKIWDKIKELALKPSEASGAFTSEYVNENIGSCGELYEREDGKGAIYKGNSFVINPKALASLENMDANSSTDEILVKSLSGSEVIESAARLEATPTFPRLLYSLNEESENLSDATEGGVRQETDLTAAQGIWVTPVTSGSGVKCGDEFTPDYYDFYIRTCWDSPSGKNSSTISTTVRLYNPGVEKVASTESGEYHAQTVTKKTYLGFSTFDDTYGHTDDDVQVSENGQDLTISGRYGANGMRGGIMKAFNREQSANFSTTLDASGIQGTDGHGYIGVCFGYATFSGIENNQGVYTKNDSSCDMFLLMNHRGGELARIGVTPEFWSGINNITQGLKRRTQYDTSGGHTVNDYFNGVFWGNIDSSAHHGGHFWLENEYQYNLQTILEAKGRTDVSGSAFRNCSYSTSSYQYIDSTGFYCGNEGSYDWLDTEHASETYETFDFNDSSVRLNWRYVREGASNSRIEVCVDTDSTSGDGFCMKKKVTYNGDNHPAVWISLMHEDLVGTAPVIYAKQVDSSASLEEKPEIIVEEETHEQQGQTGEVTQCQVVTNYDS